MEENKEVKKVRKVRTDQTKGKDRIKKQYSMCFAMYCMNYSLRDIEKYTGVPRPTVHYLKNKDGWEEKKKSIDAEIQLKHRSEIKHVKEKMVLVTSTMMQLIGSKLLAAINDDKIDLKVADFKTAIQNYLLLVGDVTERIGFGERQDEKILLNELADELTPEQRAVILDLREKIKEKKRLKELQAKNS